MTRNLPAQDAMSLRRGLVFGPAAERAFAGLNAELLRLGCATGLAGILA